MAGLERSHLTNAELMRLVREHGLSVDKKTSRKQLAVELIMNRIKRIDKASDYLLTMSPDELRRYLVERMVSDREILSFLDSLGIAPPGKIRGKLADYAAREIGELGMFQRIAKGSSPENMEVQTRKNLRKGSR
ncbi:MAG: hypothetical protein E5V36_00345 [Mesorhizobium sp.]|nr:MAG: hypothetical protein E5V36_00345 [Mesorhizobium sp.]